MAIRGLDCKLYRNTASHATPTWDEIANVTDVTVSGETGQAEVSNRANNGFRAKLATLKDADISFEMLWDTADTDFAAIQTAWVNGTSIEVAVADGPIATSGTVYFNAECVVTQFEISQPLEEGVKVSVTLSPTPASFAPSFVTVGS